MLYDCADSLRTVPNASLLQSGTRDMYDNYMWNTSLCTNVLRKTPAVPRRISQTRHSNRQVKALQLRIHLHGIVLREMLGSRRRITKHTHSHRELARSCSLICGLLNSIVLAISYKDK